MGELSRSAGTANEPWNETMMRQITKLRIFIVGKLSFVDPVYSDIHFAEFFSGSIIRPMNKMLSLFLSQIMNKNG